MTDQWEQLRFATIDQLITAVKLHGSAVSIDGRTTPEGWPFRIVIAIGKPGNERAIELVDECSTKISEIVGFTARADRKEPDVDE